MCISDLLFTTSLYVDHRKFVVKDLIYRMIVGFESHSKGTTHDQTPPFLFVVIEGLKSMLCLL